MIYLWNELANLAKDVEFPEDTKSDGAELLEPEWWGTGRMRSMIIEEEAINQDDDKVGLQKKHFWTSKG